MCSIKIKKKSLVLRHCHNTSFTVNFKEVDILELDWRRLSYSNVSLS